MQDRPVRVNPSDQKQTLLISNLPTSMSDQEIFDEIRQLMGIAPFISLQIKRGPPPERKHCTCLFVCPEAITYSAVGASMYFDGYETSSEARRLLMGKPLQGMPMVVQWAADTVGKVMCALWTMRHGSRLGKRHSDLCM